MVSTPKNSTDVILPAIFERYRNEPVWVNWKAIPVEGKKPKKLPCRPDGRAAASNDPSTWTTFDEVWAAFLANPEAFAGVGIMLAGAKEIACIDLDHCLDAEGEIDPWADE